MACQIIRQNQANQGGAYLYLPRLLDSDVFTRALAAGAPSKDFFGFAYGKDEGKYVGFTYGKSTTPIMDASLLLVEPGAAAAFAESIQEPVPSPVGGGDYAKAPAPGAPPVFTEPAPGGGEQPGAAKPSRKQFYGMIELDPIQRLNKGARWRGIFPSNLIDTGAVQS